MKFLLTALILTIIWTHGHASGNYDPPAPPPVVTTINTTTLVTSTDTTGVASAIAAGQCQFDWTHSWQGCAALGNFDSNSAAAFGLGKRYNKVLFNGTVSLEEGEVGVGASVNWKF